MTGHALLPGGGGAGVGRGPSFRHGCPSSQKENDVMKVVILEDYSLGWKVRLEMQGRLHTCVKLLPRAEYLSRRCLQIPSVCLPLKRNVSRCTLLLFISPLFPFLTPLSVPDLPPPPLTNYPASSFPQKPMLLYEDPEAERLSEVP